LPSGKNFSRFIVKYLMIFMGMSFIVTATGIYFYRTYDMQKSDSALFEISQKGFSETLAKQLEDSEKGLDHIFSADVIVEDSLANDEIASLSEKIKTSSRAEAKRIFILYDNLNNRFISDLSPDLIAAKPFLEKLSTEKTGFHI